MILYTASTQLDLPAVERHDWSKVVPHGEALGSEELPEDVQLVLGDWGGLVEDGPGHDLVTSRSGEGASVPAVGIIISAALQGRTYL